MREEYFKAFEDVWTLLGALRLFHLRYNFVANILKSIVACKHSIDVIIRAVSFAIQDVCFSPTVSFFTYPKVIVSY